MPTGPPRLAPLLLLLLLTPPRDATFTVPTAVAEHTLVRMSAGGLKWTVWLIEPAARVDRDDSESGDRVIWTGPAGRYVVHAVGLGPDDRPREHRAEVTIGGGTPTPGPTPPDPTPPVPPKPNPIPTPTPPAAGTLHVTLFLGDATMAYLRTDPALKASLKASDCVYRSYMATEPEARPYAPIVASCGGTPCVVIQDASGKVLSCCRVANAASITDCVAKVRK